MNLAARSGVKLTYDDYVLFPEDGLRHELIDGEHYVSPAPVRAHQGISANLVGSIWAHLRHHPVGRVYAAPFDVIFSPLDVVQPDVIYLSRQRLSEIEIDPWLKGAPNLVVEIASASTRRRDQTTKRLVYERYGVDEYWIVDPASLRVSVLRRAARGLEPAADLALAQGYPLTTPLLPGLVLPLATLFEV